MPEGMERKASGLPINSGPIQSRAEPLLPPGLTEPSTAIVAENEITGANAY